MRSPSTAVSFFSSGVVDASFFSSGVVDIVQRYPFFNFQPWLRLASMAPKPPTEFRFSLSADTRNQRGLFDEQDTRARPRLTEISALEYGKLASSKTLAIQPVRL